MKLMATLTGDIRVLLSGERVALNYLQRMSGIAHLYKTGRKTSGRKQSNTSGYQKNDAKLPCI